MGGHAQSMLVRGASRFSSRDITLPLIAILNDLPERVDSQIRLFSDECLQYRPINSPKDHLILQQDLSNLQTWAVDWGMKTNAK